METDGWFAFGVTLAALIAACGSPDYIEIDDPALVAAPPRPAPGSTSDAKPAPRPADPAPPSSPSPASRACDGGDGHARDPATDHCYILFSSTKRSWTDARDACAASGMHLATITGAKENEIVRALVPASSLPFTAGTAWIGAEDLATEGTFRWVDTGSTPTFTSWGEGKPNDENGTNDCVSISTGGRWDDEPCSDKRAFICERD